LKPVVQAVVETTVESAHEEFFWSDDNEIFWSVEYPERKKLSVVGWEPVE
jgi:hypothetical protein